MYPREKLSLSLSDIFLALEVIAACAFYVLLKSKI